MARTGVIRVLVVDDYALMRAGLVTFFTVFDDLELVGEASDGQEAVKLCGQMQPDVVLMDILMPSMNGVEATRVIRQHYPMVNVVVLTSTADDELIEAALEAGAAGYILKTASIDELANSLRKAAL
jgi:NarL family two-component system response regulator LiaR